MTAREKKLKMFQEGKQRLEDENKKKENQKNYTKEYDKLDYVTVKEKDWTLVRFVGSELPPNDPQREPTGMKEIQRSYIVNDENRGFYCNWSYDKNWILWKIYNKIMEYTWDDSKPQGQNKIYKNVSNFPVLFERCKFNGKSKETRMKWENGWWPTKHIISNVLDRLDYDWHIANKKFKLISKKASEKDGNTFYEPGLPPSIYHNELYPKIIETYGFLEDYDIGIRKIKGKDGITYDVQHSKFLVDEAELAGKVCNDLLTEEELSWEMYNLDKYFRISSYQKIMKNLGIFIQSVDAKMGTNFYTELEELVEAEKKLFDELYGNNEDYVAVLPEVVKEEVKPVETTNTTPVTPARGLSQDFDTVAPFVKDLSEYEKKLVRGVQGDKVIFVEEVGLDSTFPECPNTECKGIQPNELENFCIYCGEKFK